MTPLPCPFPDCKMPSTVRVRRTTNSWVACLSCNAEGPAALTEAEAVARWNAVAQKCRQADAFRKLIETLLASAVPHPVEHPTMTAAWKQARAALAGGGE